MVPAGKPVLLAHDLAFLGPLRHTIDDRRYPYVMGLEISAERGQAIASGLELKRRPGGPAITGERIRELPIGEILSTRLRGMWDSGFLLTVHPSASGATATMTPGVDVLERGGLGRLGRKGPTEETIKAVATVFALARFIGDPPAEAVRDAFGVSLATAGRWIARAKEEELIEWPNENVRRRPSQAKKRIVRPRRRG